MSLSDFKYARIYKKILFGQPMTMLGGKVEIFKNRVMANLRFDYREWKNIHVAPSGSPSRDRKLVTTTYLASSPRIASLATKIGGP